MRIGWIALIALGVVVLVAPVEAGSTGPPAPEPSEISEFRAFLENVHNAQIEFVQGRPAAFKALWSHSPHVTIFGGYGGGEQGWDKVGPRPDWGGAQSRLPGAPSSRR
jgi:hypothetical protein